MPSGGIELAASVLALVAASADIGRRIRASKDDLKTSVRRVERVERDLDLIRRSLDQLQAPYNSQSINDKQRIAGYEEEADDIRELVRDVQIMLKSRKYGLGRLDQIQHVKALLAEIEKRMERLRSNISTEMALNVIREVKRGKQEANSEYLDEIRLRCARDIAEQDQVWEVRKKRILSARDNLKNLPSYRMRMAAPFSMPQFPNDQSEGTAEVQAEDQTEQPVQANISFPPVAVFPIKHLFNHVDDLPSRLSPDSVSESFPYQGAPLPHATQPRQQLHKPSLEKIDGEQSDRISLPATSLRVSTDHGRNARESKSNNDVLPFSDSGYGTARVEETRGEQNDQMDRSLSPLINLEGHETDPNGQELDDRGTIYSHSSSLSNLDSVYVSEFANDLLNHFCPNPDSQTDETMKKVFEILPEMLRAFALKLGYEAPTQKHRDIMFFVHRFRSNIAAVLEHRYSTEKNSLLTLQADTVDKKRFVQTWLDGLDTPYEYTSAEEILDNEDAPDHFVDSSSDEEVSDEGTDEEVSDEGTNEKIDKPNILTYQHLLLEAPAYTWLLTRLNREISYTRPDSMEDIRQIVLFFLPNPRHISRKRPTQAHKATFELEWDPVDFVKQQQYKEEPIHAVEAAITLTGTCKDAQALVCIDYLQQIWPTSGEHVLRLIQDLISNGTHRCCTRELPDHTLLTAWINNSKFLIDVDGTADSIAEIGELLAWLGSALRSSPDRAGVVTCHPTIEHVPVDTAQTTLITGSGSRTTFQIKFQIHRSEDRLDLQYEQKANGQCWHEMFRNPVVVKGYPIPRRPKTDTGLEVPLDIITTLVRTRRVNIFNGKLFIKGFSAMLVPTKRCGDLLLWHYLYNTEGQYISYLDNTVTHADNVGIYDLKRCRHIVGWSSEVKLYAGAPDANYNIDRSRLKRPGPGYALEKVTLSGGQFIMPGASIAIGIKDTPVHVSCDSDVQKLQRISKVFVVLWDEQDKRGWLVDGTSALLHLLRASLEINRTDKFHAAFRFEHHRIAEPPTSIRYTDQAAIDFFLNKANMELEIYPGNEEMYNEETRSPGREQQYSIKRRITRYCVKDRVEELYDKLDHITTHQVDAARQKGVKLKLKAQKSLEGWDFKALANDDPNLFPMVTKIQAFGTGWVDFVRSINAVTFFGMGFGEIVRPTHPIELCNGWVSLPKGKFYLAVCISTLKDIMEIHGNQKEYPMRLSEHTTWYCSTDVFKSCQCKRGITDKHSGLVQPLWRTKSTDRPKGIPIQLPDGGAVIFGHRIEPNYPQRNTEGPMDGVLLSPPEGSEAEFYDSALGSSISRSAGMDNETIASCSQPTTEVESSASTIQSIPSGPTREGQLAVSPTPSTPPDKGRATGDKHMHTSGLYNRKRTKVKEFGSGIIKKLMHYYRLLRRNKSGKHE